jgi:putative chitinase
MITITPDLLRKVAPQYITNRELHVAQYGNINAIAPLLTVKMDAARINTGFRAAMFLGQTCEETMGFSTFTEMASGEAYEGRKDLGNIRAGDGPLFKGRGLIQITGRANYIAYGKLLGLDLVNNPESAAEPENAVAIAIEFWTQHKLNDLADRKDIQAITKIINGGLNGLADRTMYYTRALQELMIPPTATVPPIV